MECINSGVDKIRLNPGNMPIEKVKSIRDAMKAKGIALRIGVNSGSLGKYGRATLSNIDPFSLLSMICWRYSKKGLLKT